MTDGLSPADTAARFRTRRNAVMATASSPIFITSTPHGPTKTAAYANLYVPIFQDPVALFLCGITQLGYALQLDPTTQTTTLYLPKKNPTAEFWEGAAFGYDAPDDVDQIRKTCGIDVVCDIAMLRDHVTAQATTHGQLTSFWRAGSGRVFTDHHNQFRQRLKRWSSVPIHNCQDAYWDLQLVLDSTDIAQLRQAVSYTATAFQAVATHSFESETALAGTLIGELLQHSADGLSFSPIVANEKNATVLHYTANNASLKPNTLTLLDFGVRVGNMHSDVSRVIPVSGRFNPLQRQLMAIVLAAQAHVEALATPGVTINDLNTACWDHLNAELSAFRLAGGVATLPYDKAPHGVSHLIGYSVHDGDPFRAYKKRALVPGNVISNEPGVYGYFEAKIDGVWYKEWIGIRLEDDLLITPGGCENLTKDIPKTPEQIETLHQRHTH